MTAADPAAVRPPVPPDRSLRTVAWVGWAALILIGCGLRLVNLSGPISGDHAFRQTQTAWTARAFVRDGVSLAHAPVPVLGPPWDVPFEMPLYQALAATLTKAAGLSVETACRVVAAAFFFSSGAVLFVLARVLFGGVATAAAATLVFVWSPTAVVWSHAVLMEYVAVCFALLYTLAMVLALRDGTPAGRAAGWAVAAVAFGCLGGLVKVTTMAIAVPPVLTAINLHWSAARREGRWRERLRHRWPLHAAVLAAVLVPLAVSEAWVLHADAIKRQSLITDWLASTRLAAFTYGTLAQRVTPADWAVIGGRVVRSLLPGLIVLLPIAGVLTGPRRSRAWAAAALAGAMLPVLLFFNLYVQHSYYLAALTPPAALAAGAGLATLCGTSPGRWAAALAVCVACIVAVWDQTRQDMSPLTADAVAIAPVINRYTTPDQYVLVQGIGWVPPLLYFADRRGLMWCDDPASVSPADLRRKLMEMGPEHFGMVVYTDQLYLADVFPHAKVVTQVGPFTVASLR